MVSRLTQSRVVRDVRVSAKFRPAEAALSEAVCDESCDMSVGSGTLTTSTRPAAGNRLAQETHMELEQASVVAEIDAAVGLGSS